MIHFEIPKNQSSIIKVIGVGGGGSNAVNYMHSLGIEGVDFVVCNTDSQALALSPIANKIQLGPHLTQGLGAGANPEIGKQASEESLEDIAKILKVNTRMAFITAGMGGGTGTGGAPVVAKICRELGILTVGIVTMPFTYEGRTRMKQAQEGIDRMREHVDTILIISNDKLRQQFGALPYTQAFSKADDILATAAKCITDVINTTGQINVDFADVCTVMKNGGVAILGNAAVAGENRALHAVEQALNSPLLNDSDIRGAKWILLNINSSSGDYEHTIDEAEAIQAYVQQQAGENCDVILGMGHDASLEDRISGTVIATGFDHKEIAVPQPQQASEQKKVVTLQTNQEPQQAPASHQIEEKMEEAKEEDPLAPRLMVSEEVEKSTVQPKEGLSPTPARVEPADDGKAASKPLTLVVKEEKKEEPIQTPRRELTAEEMEEKRRFEEQKRALEERAERLRAISFNIQAGKEVQEELENVPAYIQRNVPVDDSVASAETFYSGYTVGKPEEKPEEKAQIQSVNTFLEGNKPD